MVSWQRNLQVKESKARADLKATWPRAIEDKLTVDKAQINEKERDRQAKQLEAVKKEAVERLEIDQKLQKAKIDLKVASGEMTEQQGVSAKENVEQVTDDAKLLIQETFYQKMLDLMVSHEEKGVGSGSPSFSAGSRS